MVLYGQLLLGQYITERIISETCDAACRMVHLSTAVAHVVSRGRYIPSVSVTRTRRCMPSYSNEVVILPSVATMLDELCELPMSQYDLARNMSYLVSYMNSIVS